MYSVYVRISKRSGNPEVWAFSESNSGCEIVYGSLLTGGLTKATKQSGYSSKKVNEKIREGYSAVTSGATNADISNAKDAFKGSSKSLSKEAYAIYEKAKIISGLTPNASLSPNRQQAPVASSQSAAPAVASTSTSKAATPKKSTSSMGIGFTSTSDSNSAWAW